MRGVVRLVSILGHSGQTRWVGSRSWSPVVNLEETCQNSDYSYQAFSRRSTVDRLVMCVCVAQCRDPNRHARRVVAAVQILRTISNDVESMDGSFNVVGCRPVTGFGCM